MLDFGPISACLPENFINSANEEGYCQRSSTDYYGNVQNLYFTWPYYNVPEGTKLTRRFYRNGDFCGRRLIPPVKTTGDGLSPGLRAMSGF